MNNKEFITELSRRSGYSQEQCQLMVHQLVDTMISRFEEGEAVQVPGFGTFEVKKRMERIIVSPTTKKRMLVPPKLVLGFRPVASIKEKLKRGGDNE